VNYATERVSERCQIKAKRQQRAKQGTTIEPLRGIFRTCLKALSLSDEAVYTCCLTLFLGLLFHPEPVLLG